jgi:ribonuclease P protein component
MAFYILKIAWYYRGNVVHIQPQEEKKKDHSRVFSTPGDAYGPPCYFAPPRKRKEEIGRLKGFIELHPIMAIKVMSLPSDQFRARGYKTTATPAFLLKTKKNSSEFARIGCVVGKSVHKTAVKRNFWKRQAFAGITAHAKEGSDILIIVSPNTDRLTKKQFQKELKKAMATSQIK